MKYCEFNGCKNKIESGSYCKEHKPKNKKKKRKKEIYHSKNKSFYRSDHWQALRDYVYERDGGLCTNCGRFVYGRFAHCHHIVPIADDPTLKLEPNNIILVCPKCHAILENEEKPKKVFASYFNIAPPT